MSYISIETQNQRGEIVAQRGRGLKRVMIRVKSRGEKVNPA